MARRPAQDSIDSIVREAMDGVVRRAGEETGEPREVVIEGSPEAFEELMKEFDPALLESNQP